MGRGEIGVGKGNRTGGTGGGRWTGRGQVGGQVEKRG